MRKVFGGAIPRCRRGDQMNRKLILGGLAALTMGGALATSSAPAEAHWYGHGGYGYGGYHRAYYGYPRYYRQHYYRPHYYRPVYYGGWRGGYGYGGGRGYGWGRRHW